MANANRGLGKGLSGKYNATSSEFGKAFQYGILYAQRAVPEEPEQPPAWQTGLAHLMHWALYALMIGLPLAGWVILSAAGKPIPFFGLELPPLISETTRSPEAQPPSRSRMRWVARRPLSLG